VTERQKVETDTQQTKYMSFLSVVIFITRTIV